MAEFSQTDSGVGHDARPAKNLQDFQQFDFKHWGAGWWDGGTRTALAVSEVALLQSY
ncbi:hypothetical protein ACZ87_02465 [Candidatus Erwinia dacicola]|uniref:Uncharacterized protein n=1 Tax=Candidatus Erwinia dacicola TaxID=252393 RepID=A0A328TMP6_9GAMM|nr:hypothetical protein ACZ87_02465 [Candidatus Erwinia dacicola]